MGRGAARAEDGDDDDDDDGDDAHGHDDHQQHVAVQGRRGAAMGTVTACEGWEERKGSFITQEKQAVPTKDSQQIGRRGGSQEQCLFLWHLPTVSVPLFIRKLVYRSISY